MPYDVTEDATACSATEPWAVKNKTTGKLHGCHPTKAAAEKQQAALYVAEKKMAELETEDIEGVELLRAGVRIHGVGSPPEGDLYEAGDLADMASATMAANGKRPVKIGHSDKQKLLRDSGLTDGEMPAAGWLENVRADGEKLLGDLRAVPKKVAKLARAGAFRTRSVEMKKNADGKWGITALALLGAKAPAVKTLDDIVALYEEAEIEHEETDVAYLVYAAGDVVWDPSASFETLRSKINQVLNPGPDMGPRRYWVRDIATGKALVSEGWASGAKAWVVSYTVADDGSVEVSASSDWTAAEEAWVETAKGYSGKTERPADIGAMDDLTLTAEAQRELAESLGIELEDGASLTQEQIEEAYEAKSRELEEAKKTPEPKGDEKSFSELVGETEEGKKLLEDAKAGREAKTKLFEMERDAVVDKAIVDAKIDPAKRADWQRHYEENAELTQTFLEDLEPRDEFRKEFGADGDEEAQTAIEREYEEEIARNAGVSKEELL